MILKRYGTSYQSVGPNFESKALNEIGFRRDRVLAVPVTDFETGYEEVAIHELSAEAQGAVQDQTEQTLLDRLQQQLQDLEVGVGDDHVLVVLNGDATEWPKTRQTMTNVVVEGENRFHFTYTVAPALRVGVYRRRG